MSLNLREFLTDMGYTDLRVVRGKLGVGRLVAVDVWDLG